LSSRGNAEPNKRSREVTETDLMVRLGQNQVVLLLLPNSRSSDTQLSGEAETRREPGSRRPHCAGIRRWRPSKQVCWWSGGGVFLGPTVKRSSRTSSRSRGWFRQTLLLLKGALLLLLLLSQDELPETLPL